MTESARGEWLQYLDADDYLLPGKISSQLASIAKTESAIDVIYSPVIIRDMEHPKADHVMEITDQDETVTLIRWGALNTGGLLLRRSAVLRAGGWRPDQPCCQEHELLLRLRMAGCAFFLHNYAQTVYRRHSAATVSRRDPMLTIRTRMKLTDGLEDYLNSSGKLTPSHREALFTARMESARSAFPVNPALAKELCAKAECGGRSWVSGSPALPVLYQVALRLAGFVNTERLAAWVRGRPFRITARLL